MNDICELCDIQNTTYTPVYIKSIRKPCIEIWNKKNKLSSKCMHYYVCKRCYKFIKESYEEEEKELKQVLIHEKRYKQSKINLFFNNN